MNRTKLRRARRSHLHVAVEAPIASVVAGRRVRVPIRLEVRRGGALAVRLEIDGLSDGWSASLPLSDLLVRPGHPIRVVAAVCVPPTACTGDRQTLLVSVAGWRRFDRLVDLVVS